jgi:hypothetical protein
MIEIICNYTDPPHVHEYPDDWIFGGADGLHPGADPRFKPSSYTYYDDKIMPCWVTSAPLCDDQALDECTWIASLGKSFTPKYISVRRPDGTEEMLLWEYDKVSDTLTPMEAPNGKV